MRSAVALVLCVLVSQAHAASRPNIVLILADDMGYSDLGCYGGEIKTPHIDSLARHGLRFTQFYNCGRCCPTRASLMTGLYPHQAGVGRMTNDAKLPGYRGQLLPDCVTIAEVLHAAGYRTAMAGKWHLSNAVEGPDHLKYLSNRAILDRFAELPSYPVSRGFEMHYGVIWGVVNYFDPFSLVDGTQSVREVPKDYYITDAISDQAVKYVEQLGTGPAPFFLYVAHVAPHWPLHAPEADVERYANTYLGGWDEIRAARFKRMKEMNFLPPGVNRVGPRHEPGTKWDANPDREWDARAMSVHAAMVDRLDQGVGRLVDKLRKMNLLDNTLVLFMSDNGASPEIEEGPGFDRPAQTRDGRPIRYPVDKRVMPGSEDVFATIGPFWASVANTPLRFWKAEVYEGGVCTPMIAHWPAGLKTEIGAKTDQVGHVMDVMATCVELAGADYPSVHDGKPIPPMRGKSLLPILRGENREGHKFLAWEHIGARAIRVGDWKLVAHRTGPWALYDLSRDRAEENDLSDTQPDRVDAMEERWNAWAKATAVVPAPPGGRWPKR
jgi:arylsulfatase